MRVLLVAVAVGSVEVVSWRVRRHASHPFSCQTCGTAHPGPPITGHQHPKQAFLFSPAPTLFAMRCSRRSLARCMGRVVHMSAASSNWQQAVDPQTGQQVAPEQRRTARHCVTSLVT